MLGLALAGVGVTYVLTPRAAPAVVRFPKALFDTQLSAGLRHTGGPANVFAVAPDGQRFLMLKAAAGSGREATASTITVVLNWTALLKK